MRLSLKLRELTGNKKGRMGEAEWTLPECACSIDCHAELFAENCFDPIHVTFHVREFFLHVGHSFEELVERRCEPVELLIEPLLHPVQPPFNGNELLVNCSGRLFKTLVNGTESFINCGQNLGFLGFQAFVNGPQDDLGLIGEKPFNSLIHRPILCFSGSHGWTMNTVAVAPSV
jgi:hypothetical protein